MSDYKLTVGMEIHVELETKTKMFCGCPNDPFHSKPNTNVCPVCYGLPGALPLINKEAVAMVVRFGRAVKAEIAPKTFWARKNYFYPDLPKGYQISQSTLPLVNGGQITIDGETYHLNHAHLEEDAGKLKHDAGGQTLADYNRAGVPLLEIVTEPGFHSAEAAKKFCQELQRIFRTLKISTADIEKGQMRCEANISVSKTDKLGTKVEVKNIGSFRMVEKAIKYEYDRQVKALENGEKLVQETRNWDDVKGKTVVMRTKETSADYRYFPEPDLPMVSVSVAQENSGTLLPDEQRSKLAKLGLHKEVISAVVDKGGFALVVRLAEQDKNSALEAGKLFLAIPEFALLPESEKKMILQIRKEKGFTATAVKELISRAVTTGQTIEDILPKSDSIDLNNIVSEILSAHADAVANYKAGKEAAFQFLVGQVMAKTKGRANIQEVRAELERAL